MSSPAESPEKEAAADRAKAASRESAHWLRDEAQRLYTGYAKQSKFFKWRSWIVATYVVIALTSVVMAMPPLNHINAYVKADYDYERRMILGIRNDSASEWTDVHIVLDGAWEYTKNSVQPNELVSANVTQFSPVGGRTGEKAPANLRPKVVVVKTDHGSFKTKLTED
jgi:hypothetical protein